MYQVLAYLWLVLFSFRLVSFLCRFGARKKRDPRLLQLCIIFTSHLWLVYFVSLPFSLHKPKKKTASSFSDLRNDWLAGGDVARDMQTNYTVRVERIPRAFRSPAILQKFFSTLFPGQVGWVGYGVVWYGMVWYGMVWYGMVWYGMVWYGTIWYGMVRYGMILDGVVWYGMVWYGTVRNDI